MHSHHNLEQIFYHLWDMKLVARGTFVDLVFRLVMFHQSLDGVTEWPPIYSLSDYERVIYCDRQFFRIMKILMIADSESY
jgi:hypothetical protein